jgi:hypothetical protein
LARLYNQSDFFNTIGQMGTSSRLFDHLVGASEWQERGPSSHSQPHLVQPARLKPRMTRQMTMAKRFGMAPTLADRDRGRETCLTRVPE